MINSFLGMIRTLNINLSDDFGQKDILLKVKIDFNDKKWSLVIASIDYMIKYIAKCKNKQIIKL